MCMENYKYFKDNLAALYVKYPERYLIIKDQDIVDDYDTFDSAYQAAIVRFEEGTFLIQHCIKGDGGIYFASLNVAFVGV